MVSVRRHPWDLYHALGENSGIWGMDCWSACRHCGTNLRAYFVPDEFVPINDTLYTLKKGHVETFCQGCGDTRECKSALSERLRHSSANSAHCRDLYAKHRSQENV